VSSAVNPVPLSHRFYPLDKSSGGGGGEAEKISTWLLQNSYPCQERKSVQHVYLKQNRIQCEITEENIWINILLAIVYYVFRTDNTRKSRKASFASQCSVTLYKMIFKRFKILHGLKMSACRDISPCGLTEVDRGFGNVYCLHHQGCRLHTRRHGNLYSHITQLVCTGCCLGV
jgi:hypothetical protein